MEDMQFRIAALVLCLGSATSAVAADAAIVEEIVAKVNGDIITRTELERTRKQMESELQQRGLRGTNLADAMREREKDVLRDRIDQLLLVQKGKELSINVESELSKYLADLRVKSGTKDDDSFQAWIKEQANMPFEDFRAELRNSMLTQRVVGQEVGSRINIPPAERQKYYEEHKSEFNREERVYLREILVSTEGKDEQGVAAAEKKAKDLVARARKSERFSELARDNSDGATAKDEGELGWWKKGELDKSLEEIVFAKGRNYVTDPIRRPNGFLILKVEDHQKAGQATFEEVDREITDKLFMPRMQPRIREYLTKLRQEAFLEIKDSYVDSAAAPGKETKWTDPAQLKPETVTKEEVASRTRRRRLLWTIPIPGTQTAVKGSSSN
jgi:parvulin-like peptidyl-prolyl isomerase